MRIAYIILAHKLPAQLVRLVHKLNTDMATFHIHIDKKTNDETYQKFYGPLSGYANITFLRRHRRYYGDYNHVRGTLDGIRRLLASGDPFDYVVLLTGQDYPIRPNDQIENILKESGGQCYIDYFPLPSDQWRDEDGGLDRINYWHFRLFGQERMLLKKAPYFKFVPNRLWLSLGEFIPFQRNMPGNFKKFGGSAYWCLPKDCIEYIDEFVRQNGDFVKFFKRVKIPDEIFFQTVLMNSDFKDRMTNDNLRYIVWMPNSRHPEILQTQDFSNFMDSNKLFARKFDITENSEVLDLIDKEIS